jgi:tetratricopeptide (TPR) repeat protein
LLSRRATAIVRPKSFRDSVSGKRMNKVKWIAFYQWAMGLLDEWLTRIDPKGVLRNPLYNEIETALGRRIHVLVAPLGSDLKSRLYRFLLRRSIKRAFGHAVNIVALAEPLAWSGEDSFDLFTQQRAQAQKLLQNNHCDVLILRLPASGSAPLLRLISVEGKSLPTYAFIEKFGLPVPFDFSWRRLLAARLFVASAQAVHMGDDMRIPLLRKLMTGLAPVSAATPEIRGSTLVNYAFLHRMLGEAGCDDDLKKAAQAYQDALKEFNRERDPLAWAAVQDDLGEVLRLIGEKEHDASTLQQAVVAFNEALSERTRERAPMQWAATQCNLGLTLASLGAQKQTIRLEEAISAFQAASTEWTRERMPLDWAKVQHDIGRVLLRLSDQSKDTARLEQAIAAFRAALEERRHEWVRPQWAMTQHNLGNALLRLGDRNKGTAELHEAVTAFRAALKERSRHVFPQQWSAIQHSLGATLTAVGQREADRAYLQQAIEAYREALKVRTRKHMPREWATSRNDLGTALLRLAELENDPVVLKESIAALEDALLERTRASRPLQWAATQSNLGAALSLLAESETGSSCLERAAAAYRSSLEVYEEASIIHAAKATRANLTAVETRLKTVTKS